MVLPDGVRESAAYVRDKKIESIHSYDAKLSADRDVDLGNLALLPGLVDTHVHVNEPGRTEWEGFASATRAALAGGVTTICDMPLNSVPVTVSVEALREKAAAAAGQCAVDVAFWGGAVPGNAAAIGPLLEAGVVGFKCFLIDSGIAEFPPLSRDELRAAMKELAAGGAPMIVHAEDPAEISVPNGPGYDAFVASRPPVAERRAIETVIRAAAATGARAHIVHLAAGECAALIDSARAAGISLSAVTCPHYLSFAAEEVPRGRDPDKCCPPVRYAPNREALWRALGVGVIDCVVSDHLPCPPALNGSHRTGTSGTAWGGIASLQIGLPAVWTGGAAARALARGRGAMDGGVSRVAGRAAVEGTDRGRVRRGLRRVRPGRSFVVRGSELLHRHPLTPYDGRTLTGVVSRVWLGGAEVSPDGEPRGRLLRRGGGTL